MSISDSLLQTAAVTRGRFDAQRTFRDFLAYCAYHLSNATDPVHLESRQEQLSLILRDYNPREQERFAQTFQLLADETGRNLRRGNYVDILGPVYKELHPKSGALKQDFSPLSLGKVMGRIITDSAKLPEQGYFTFMEPTCGSGVLCLAHAEEVAGQGYNPCEQLVIQASDLDSRCVHMTYIQLALYGVPAVVIQGNTFSLEECDRWYTPLYLLRNWIWREPMPFRPGRNKSDEQLKMLTEPWYAKARYLGNWIRKMESGEETSHE